MPPLKQPVPLRDLAMDLMVTFFANYCDQTSTLGLLDKLRHGIGVLKTEISPHIPWQISAVFHEKILEKYFFRPDYEPRERPDSHKRAVLEIIMDSKITGLKCLLKILAALDPGDAHRIHGLKELDLSFFADIAVPYSIENFHLEDLTTLRFEHKCTDEALETIGRTCRKLEYLNISLSGKVTDKGLRGIHPCSELRVLWLCRCFGVTHRAMYELVSVHGKIQKLVSWDDESLTKDRSVHPSINCFSIGIEFGRVLSKHLRAVAAKFPNLGTIAFSGLLKGDLSLLKSMSKLTQLDLSDVIDFDWDNLERLLTVVGGKISDLRLCCTHRWTGMTQDKLNFLAQHCPNIEHLQFYRVPDSHKEVLAVPHFPKLKVLVCVVPSDYYDCHVDLEFGEMPSLEKLVVSAVHITNEWMEAVILDGVKFPRLKAVTTYEVPGDVDYQRVPIETTSDYDVERMQKIVRDNNLDLDIKDMTDY